MPLNCEMKSGRGVLGLGGGDWGRLGTIEDSGRAEPTLWVSDLPSDVGGCGAVLKVETYLKDRKYMTHRLILPDSHLLYWQCFCYNLHLLTWLDTCQSIWMKNKLQCTSIFLITHIFTKKQQKGLKLNNFLS